MAKRAGEEFVVRSGPERALRMPQMVSGMRIDLRSLRVNR